MFKSYLATAVVAVCFIVASFGTPAHADEASHRRAAEEVLILSDSDKNFEKGFLLGFSAQTKNLPPEMQKAGLAWAGKYLTWDTIKEDVIKLYTENFTEDELKDIAAFYRTPTGKKTITLVPALLGKGMEIAQQKVAAHRDELVASMAAAQKEVEAREALEKPQPNVTPPK